VAGYLTYGIFFIVTGVLGVVGGLLLFFWGQAAVAQDNKPLLRKLLLPMAIIGFIPSPGLVFVGFMLLFTWMMYRDDRYDFFGLLLEDVSRKRRRVPVGAEAAGAGYGDTREAYAAGYTEQSLYSDDYASAAYGGGEDSYSAGGSLLDAIIEEEPAAQPAPVAEEPSGPPMCATCGKPTEWIEEYGRYYCYDDDAYV
jgi:hypothetical protein